ncbi:MAG: aminotransferase class IV [Ginsengibacter sp.]
MNEFFIYNGQFFLQGKPVISAGNSGLRYGDGLFETMRLSKGRILNIDYHFERLFNGLSLLKFESSKSKSREFFTDKIFELLKKNNHQKEARIRLMVFRGEGSVFESKNNSPNFIIETWQLPHEIEWNENGLFVDIYPDAVKACDQFANLKSNNFIPYIMAGRFAKEQKLNDAFVLNSFGRVCDTSVANVFAIKEKNIFTPPLSEGCIAGTMRRWMLEKLALDGFVVKENILTKEDLLEAVEIFVTNAIHPVRWVKCFKEKSYGNKTVRRIFEHTIQHL